jgi:hypothetical protein
MIGPRDHANKFSRSRHDADGADRSRRNQRMNYGRARNDLGVMLIHPTYREGLRAILAADQREAGQQGTANK